MEPAAGPCLLLFSGNVHLTSAGGHLYLQQEFVSNEPCFKVGWGFFLPADDNFFLVRIAGLLCSQGAECWH